MRMTYYLETLSVGKVDLNIFHKVTLLLNIYSQTQAR